MTTEANAIPPSVSWAQRSARVFVIFNVECEKPDIKIDKKSISFRGVCAPERKIHQIEIPLYAEIDPNKSKHFNKGRLIEVVLAKESTDEGFWPTLTSDQKKHHWLKVDFQRWQDEDDSEEEAAKMFKPRKIGHYGDEIEKDGTSSEEEEDLPDAE